MGFAIPSWPRRALTALPTLSEPDYCPTCAQSNGLCGREDCKRAVLPQLAINGGWLRLMGEARTEQKERQAPEPAEKVQIERIARRNARKVARSSRKGYFGLAKAIMRAE